MMLRAAALLTAGLLLLNGWLHGLLSHRWVGTDSPAVRAAGDRLALVPRRVGEWDGQVLDTPEATLPEEQVGRNVTVRYMNRVDGNVVAVYLACGPTETMIPHTPADCYPAHGYRA